MGYIHQRKGRSGYYGQRKVPPALRDRIGTSCWMRKLGASLVEARRNLPQFLAETDLLIAEARGELDPVRKIRSLLPDSLNHGGAFDVVEEYTRVPAHIEVGPGEWTENPEFIKLVELVQARRDGSDKQPRSKEELLQLAASLKQPARATADLWNRHLSALMESCGKESITDITEEDVLNFRAQQLEHITINSLKTKLRYIRALLEIAKDQRWIDNNPADGATKHMVSKVKIKEVVRLDQADSHWEELPEPQHLLWHLCRWTGAHISEVAGLKGDDIDLKESVINIRPNECRDLKNPYRQRLVPIHSKLLPYLKQAKGAVDTKDQLVFPWAYNAERGRWCEGISWKRKLGITPKATRDWAASCLRDQGVNEFVIGKLFGHSPKTITGQYGSVSQQALAEALELLS